METKKIKVYFPLKEDLAWLETFKNFEESSLEDCDLVFCIGYHGMINPELIGYNLQNYRLLPHDQNLKNDLYLIRIVEKVLNSKKLMVCSNKFSLIIAFLTRVRIIYKAPPRRNDLSDKAYNIDNTVIENLVTNEQFIPNFKDCYEDTIPLQMFENFPSNVHTTYNRPEGFSNSSGGFINIAYISHLNTLTINSFRYLHDGHPQVEYLYKCINLILSGEISNYNYRTLLNIVKEAKKIQKPVNKKNSSLRNDVSLRDHPLRISIDNIEYSKSLNGLSIPANTAIIAQILEAIRDQYVEGIEMGNPAGLIRVTLNSLINMMISENNPTLENPSLDEIEPPQEIVAGRLYGTGGPVIREEVGNPPLNLITGTGTSATVTTTGTTGRLVRRAGLWQQINSEGRPEVINPEPPPPVEPPNDFLNEFIPNPNNWITPVNIEGIVQDINNAIASSGLGGFTFNDARLATSDNPETPEEVTEEDEENLDINLDIDDPFSLDEIDEEEEEEMDEEMDEEEEEGSESPF